MSSSIGSGVNALSNVSPRSATCAHGALWRGIERWSTPIRDLNHWRSWSVRDTAAIGRPKICPAMRVIRSKLSLGAVSSRFKLYKAARRASSSCWNITASFAPEHKVFVFTPLRMCETVRTCPVFSLPRLPLPWQDRAGACEARSRSVVTDRSRSRSRQLQSAPRVRRTCR